MEQESKIPKKAPLGWREADGEDLEFVNERKHIQMHHHIFS